MHFCRTSRAALALALAGGLAARADDVLPKPEPAARYKELANRSPFSPPSAAPATPVQAAQPQWSDKLAVTSIVQQGGVYFATLLDRDTSERSAIDSKQENSRGMVLADVHWSEQISQAWVTVRRGTDFGKVLFDASAATPPSAAGRPVAVQQQPPQLPGNGFRPAPGMPPLPGQPPVNLVRRNAVIRGGPQPPSAAPAAGTLKDDDDDE